jgi:cyclic dehypoxanthinyl futalosine synthase
LRSLLQFTRCVGNLKELMERISTQQARELWQSADDESLFAMARVQRAKWHKADEATYVIMAIINYTNICVAKCDYCSFYRLPHQSGTYLLNQDQIFSKIDALLDLGGQMVGFNGGFHPKLKIHDYALMFQNVRDTYGDRIEFYGMTVAEFMFSCKLSRLSYADGARILADHGSKWVTGGGAEILHDAFRKRHSPGKYLVEDYFSAQKAILDAGMGSTATMVIGFDESLDERLLHLERLRRFQDESHVPMPSFLCWTYKPFNNELGGTEISSKEYIRWLALCRIYLDNFKHIRTSVLTKNDDALQALQHSADDFDLPTEDEVTQKAGAQISLEFANILEAVESSGIKPLLRKPFTIAKHMAKQNRSMDEHPLSFSL